MTTTTDTQNGTFGGKTGEQWRQMAREARHRSAESWERSDTDGFLSQWASDTMAARYSDNATIADDGGMIEYPALFDLDGHVIRARYFEGTYGWCWMVLDQEGQRTGQYLTESGARKASTRMANNRKKGFTIGRVMIPAHFDSSESRVSLRSVLVDPAEAVVIETETALKD